MPLHVFLLGVSIIKISRFCQNSSLQPKQSSVHPGGALFFEEIYWTIMLKCVKLSSIDFDIHPAWTVPVMLLHRIRSARFRTSSRSENSS